MILGIDPGDHTGYAVCEDRQIIATGEIIYTQKNNLKHMEELIYFEAIRKLYREYKPDLVVVETNFMGRFVAVVKALTKKLTIIELAIKMEFPESLIVKSAPSEWKGLLEIPAKTKKNRTPEKEKVLERLKKAIPGYISQGEHIDDSVAMCLAYAGKVRIKR